MLVIQSCQVEAHIISAVIFFSWSLKSSFNFVRKTFVSFQLLITALYELHRKLYNNLPGNRRRVTPWEADIPGYRWNRTNQCIPLYTEFSPNVLKREATLMSRYLKLAVFLFFFSFFFSFLNYASMMTHSQQIWKIQNTVTYSSTIYYNYF